VSPGHILWQMFDWPGGNVLGNLIASVMWAVPTWLLILRKLHCAETLCFRPGRHEVDGTTFRTCRKHTTKPVHERLRNRHAVKFPEQHAHLNG